MNVYTPRYEIISYPKEVIRSIEEAARDCYLSEMSETDEDAESFVNNLIRRKHFAMIEFGGDIVVRFISNRGFSHEMVRHRLCSFAQESTRYCNYARGRYSSSIGVCAPISDVKGANKLILESWMRCQDDYMDLIDMGVKPEIAREVLPIGLKASIRVKANIVEWRHILTLRTSKKAHPRMRELMIPLLEEFRKLMPVVFDDIGI